MSSFLQLAARAVRDAQYLLFTAGAGMGVDSGLPDFRGNEGFWRAYPPFQRLGLQFQEVANPRWFISDPQLAWGFYGHRFNLYQATSPHDGFAILKRWSEKKSARVFTSNVDGHFQRAGFAEEDVCEVHGSLLHLQCVRPCSDAIWDATHLKIEVDENTFRAKGELPRCPNCGGLARPNVLIMNTVERV
ncbi:NAD-dependent protein deacylase [Abditibacteriota bacterium]|nr:NAD-dependent protein deacylase [Abditibacteriota bacterium]